MKQTLTTSQAAHLLMQDEYARWTYKGAHALVEHLEQLEEDCGAEIEFDRVALRCDWHEYGSAVECAAGDYNWRAKEFPELMDACISNPDNANELMEQSALEWLSEQTQVITFEGGVIVQLF